MRVAEYQLVAKLVADIGYVKLPLFAADFGIEDYVQQHVAKLFADILHIVVHNGVGEFVNLLYGVGAQGVYRLFVVPRALFPQGVHHIQESLEGGQLFFAVHSIFVY